MQEKVLNFLKANFKGIATAILVVIAVIVGFLLGSKGVSDLKSDDIVIEEVKATTTAPVATTTKKSPVYKVTVKKPVKTTASATATASTTPAQPIDYLRFFYGAGSVSAPSAPAPSMD